MSSLPSWEQRASALIWASSLHDGAEAVKQHTSAVSKWTSPGRVSTEDDTPASGALLGPGAVLSVVPMLDSLFIAGFVFEQAMLLIVVRYLTWKWWLQMSPHYSLAVTKRSIEMVFLDVSKACLSRYYFIDGLIMPFEYKKVIVIFFCLWPTTWYRELVGGSTDSDSEFQGCNSSWWGRNSRVHGSGSTWLDSWHSSTPENPGKQNFPSLFP